jgi:hypothetical protein
MVEEMVGCEDGNRLLNFIKCVDLVVTGDVSRCVLHCTRLVSWLFITVL